MARRQTYQSLVNDGINSEDIDAIRLHLQRGYALGSERFRKAIEAQLNRRVGPDGSGVHRRAICKKKVHFDPGFGIYMTMKLSRVLIYFGVILGIVLSLGVYHVYQLHQFKAHLARVTNENREISKVKRGICLNTGSKLAHQELMTNIRRTFVTAKLRSAVEANRISEVEVYKVAVVYGKNSLNIVKHVKEARRNAKSIVENFGATYLYDGKSPPRLHGLSFSKPMILIDIQKGGANSITNFYDLRNLKRFDAKGRIPGIQFATRRSKREYYLNGFGYYFFLLPMKMIFTDCCDSPSYPERGYDYSYYIKDKRLGIKRSLDSLKRLVQLGGWYNSNRILPVSTCGRVKIIRIYGTKTVASTQYPPIYIPANKQFYLESKNHELR